MATTSTSTRVTVRSAEDLGHALGLSAADTAEMEFRSALTVALAKIIRAGRLTHVAIAKRAGTSRTRVTAIANGNTYGVSTDVLILVLAATGPRAEVRVRKAAAQSDPRTSVIDRTRLSGVTSSNDPNSPKNERGPDQAAP